MGGEGVAHPGVARKELREVQLATVMSLLNGRLFGQVSELAFH